MEQGFEKEYVGDTTTAQLSSDLLCRYLLVVKLLPCLRHSFFKLYYHTNQTARIALRYVIIHYVTSRTGTSPVYLTSPHLTLPKLTVWLSGCLFRFSGNGEESL